jgi:hypothetical protein
MNKKLEKTLLETFGEPLDVIYGTKIGDVKDISKVGAVGVRGESDETIQCLACGELPIGGSCGCDHSDGKDEGQICSGCGMMVVGGKCGCAHDDVCPMCGQMPPRLDSSCGCGLTEASCAEEPSSAMPNPGDMVKDVIKMAGLGETCIDEPSSINEPSMNSVADAAGVSESDGYGQCKQCSMKEMECECDMNEGDLEEVTPPGYEPVVKALKKEPDVDNPWAIAWSMKKKGIKPRR